MALDRGELRYTIRIRDQFRGPLRQFRREIDEARRAIESLGNVRGAGRGARAAADEQRQQVREIQRGIEAQRRAGREQTRIIREQSAVRELQAQAIRRAAREQISQGLVEARQSSNRIRGLNQQAVAANRAAAGVAGIRRQTVALNKDAGRLLFTFRRLFGALAAFTLAREAAGAFRDLIGLGIRFNSQLELGRLGFAGLLTSAGEIRDAQGQLLQGQEAYNAALNVASGLQERLRQRALETTATQQELTVAFQQAIAPGLARGLDPNRILDLTVGISQAASAIGLAQNQLAEEVRAIFTGTARAQTTRLAALFGGAEELNRLVRTAAGADELFVKLTARLEGTSKAAADAARTVPGLFARIRDGLEFVAGRAAAPFFEDLRDVLGEVFNSLVVINRQTGLLEPAPKVLPAFQAIFDAVADIVERVREFADRAGFEGLITSARTLGVILTTLGGFFVGIAESVSIVGQVFSAILNPISELLGGVGELQASLGVVAEIVGTVVGLVVSARTATFLWAAAMKLVTIETRAAAAATATAEAATTRLNKKVFIFAGAAGAALFGFNKLFEAILGIDLTLSQTLEIVKLSLTTAFTTSISQIKIAFKAFANTLVGIFASPLATIANLVNQSLLQPILALAVLLPEGTRQAVEDATASIEQFLDRQAKNQFLLFDTKKDKQDLEDFLATTEQQFAALRAKITAEGSLGAGFDPEAALRAFKEFQRRLKAEGDITGRDVEVTPEQQRELNAAQRQLEVVEAQAFAEQNIADLVGRRATQAEIAVQTEQNRLAALRQEEALRKRALADEIAKLELEKQGAVGASQQAFVEQQIAQLRAKGVADGLLAAAVIDQQNEKLREQQLIVSGTIEQGLARGLENFAEQFGSAFEAGIQVAEGILNRFTSFVSQSIVDALDPTKDFDIRERFARFLQDIAQLIIQTLVQLAIAKLILGLASPGESAFQSAGSAAGSAAGSLFGGGLRFAAGGSVPGGAKHESRPPAGIPKSDTVLARLTPGEWVDPVATVSRLGADFFERLRVGAGDPSALRAMVGLATGRKIRRARANSSGFFQGGGQVAGQLRNAGAVARQSSGGGGGGGGQVVMAVVPGNDQSVERLMSGGKRAMLDFIGANASTIDGMLARNRPR